LGLSVIVLSNHRKHGDEQKDKTMTPFKFETTVTPAARKLMEAFNADDPRRVKVCVARIDLNKTDIDFVRAIPLRTRGLERTGAAAYVLDADGNRITDDKILRTVQGIKNVTDVIREYEIRTRKIITAWSGAGNVAQNEYCLAWQDGELTCRVQEMPFLEGGRAYHSLVVGPNRTAFIENVIFKKGAGDAWKPSVSAKLIVSGQLLVQDGKLSDPYYDDFHRKTYCDKRHLILFAYTKLRNFNGSIAIDKKNELPIQRDFGLDQLMNDEGILIAAIEGKIVRLSLTLTDVDGIEYAVEPSDLNEAFASKGYVLATSKADLKTGNRGFYAIEGDAVYIVFAATPYPQHVVAFRSGEPNHLFEIVIGGWSNNAGVTIPDLGRDLIKNGFDSAILLDNGGDAVFVKGDHDPNGCGALVPSSLKRTQWSGILVYSNRPGCVGEIDVKLTSVKV
jgi:hypothetical protein